MDKVGYFNWYFRSLLNWQRFREEIIGQKKLTYRIATIQMCLVPFPWLHLQAC